MTNPNAGRSSSVLLALAVAIHLAAPLTAQDRPLVAVQISIDATDFRRNLSTRTALVEQRLTEELSTLGSTRFGFLRWQPLQEVVDTTKVAVFLRAVVTDEKRVGEQQTAGSTIWLRFSAEAGTDGNAYSCANRKDDPIGFDPDQLNTLNRTLFSGTAVQPTGNPEDTTGAVLRQFDETFRNSLAAIVLSKIPFSREVRPHVEDFVKIGVRRDDLAIADDSRMLLNLCHRYLGTGHANRSLDLLAAVDKGKYPPNDPDPKKLQARVLCPADEASPCPKIFTLLKDPWHTDVFMIDFKRRFSGTLGNRAANPAKR